MTSEAERDHYGEERILYVLLILIGLIPIALAWGDGFGAQATIGGLMMAGGGAGLATRSRRR